jgi:hypothetical protein
MRWRWCRGTAECRTWYTATVLGGHPVLGNNCSCCCVVANVHSALHCTEGTEGNTENMFPRAWR